MSKAPAMPMYWDAYLADTTHLTTEEHGAYMLLLAAMWRRNAWVPDNDKDNARILGLTAQKWRKIKARLMETVSGFRIEDGKITQEKLQKTWENTQEKIEKNRSNGAKGGRPKSINNNGLAKANGSVSVNPNESIPEPEPEPDKKKEPKGSLQKKAARLSEDWFLPVEWGEWALSEGWSRDAIRTEADKFKDYWIAKSGKDATKVSWQATWRNWMRNSKTPKGGRENGNGKRSIAERLEARFSEMDGGTGGDPSEPLFQADDERGFGGSSNVGLDQGVVRLFAGGNQRCL